MIYKKSTTGIVTKKNPSKNLMDYLEGQGVEVPKIEATEEGEGMNAPINEKELEVLDF